MDIQPSQKSQSAKPAPSRRDSDQLNVRLPAGMLDALREFCNERGYLLKDFVIAVIKGNLKAKASQ
jgi:hypothetical protein